MVEHGVHALLPTLHTLLPGVLIERTNDDVIDIGRILTSLLHRVLDLGVELILLGDDQVAAAAVAARLALAELAPSFDVNEQSELLACQGLVTAWTFPNRCVVVKDEAVTRLKLADSGSCHGSSLKLMALSLATKVASNVLAT